MMMGEESERENGGRREGEWRMQQTEGGEEGEGKER